MRKRFSLAVTLVIVLLMAGAVPMCADAACVSQPSGLFSWWKAENSASDVLGANNGTLQGGIAYVAGKVGQAFSFDGVDDYADMGNSDAFNFGSGDFAISFWAYPRNGGGGNDYDHIIAKAATSSYAPYVIGIHDSKWKFWSTSNGSSWDIALEYVFGDVTLNEWQYITVTRAGNAINFYINGVLKTTITTSSGLWVNTEKLLIGKIPWTAQDTHFNGLVDEVAIFNGALSAGEVAALYGTGSDGICFTPDTTPDAFNFISQTGVPLNTSIISNPITVTGINSPTPIIINAGAFKINGSGEWVTSGTANPGDSVKVKQTSSSGNTQTTTVTLTIGGESGSFTVTTAAAGDPSASGVVSWWRAENNAYDSVGGNHGTLLNGTAFATGEDSHAFSFDGSDDSVTVPASSNWAFGTGDFSVSFWAYSETFSDHRPLINNRRTPANDNMWAIEIYPNANIVEFHSGSNIFLVATNPLTSSSWNHIAVTRSGSTLSIYINGIPSGSVSNSSNFSEINDLQIGRDIMSGNDLGGSFQGLIDEVKIFNRALTALEVSTLAGTKPDAFTFTAQTGMPLSTTIVSNPITVAGINYLTPISITACADDYCEYKINDGTWTAAGGTLSNGDSVLLRQTSSANPLTATTATLNIGGVSGGFVVTTAAASDPNAGGLLAWWKGENNAYDSIGGNNGVPQGATTYAAGQTGQAFSFSSASHDGVIVPSSVTLSPTEAITMEAWIMPAALSNDWPYIIGRRITPSGAIQFSITISNRNTFTCDLTGAGVNAEGGTIPLNQWSHVACTYDRNMLRLYVNGEQVASAAGSNAITTSSEPLTIGMLDGATNRNFDGLIDEVKIYSRALSASEIANTYGLVAWWKGDNDAFDSVGDNNGVWNGTPAYAAGKIGQAFSFDGVDDTVSVGMLNNTALNEALPFSIAAWINTSDTSPYQTIASNYMGESGGIGNYSTYLIINSGNLVFGLNKRQQEDESISTGISTGWHFVTATYDGSVLNLYLDGVLQESAVRQFTGSSDNTRGWYIGNYPPEWVSYIQTNTSFHGLIDDVKIYSRALSAAEVANSYGLVSWWRAENNALDSIGNNNAVLVGSPGFQVGTVGQSFSFNGTNQYAQVAVPLNLPLGAAPRSLSLWFKTPRNLSASTESALFQYGSASNGNMFGLISSANAPGRLYFYGHNADLFGTTVIFPDTWYHTAVSYDGSTVRLYLNGQLENSAPLALNTVLDGNGLSIGYRGLGSMWQGQIDEVKVFNRTLSVMEVSELAGTYPDSFSFSNQIGLDPHTTAESNAITVTGISQPAPISISTGAEYAVSTNGGTSWGSCTSSSGTVNANNQVKVCLTSSSSYCDTKTATLNIGGREGTFSVTTKDDTEKPVVTGFSIAATEPTTNMGIGVSLFTATDNDEVNGYMITTSSTPPFSSDPAWSTSVPTTFNLPTAGTNTLYAWAKDPSGNVSEPLSSPPQVNLKPVRRDPSTYYTSMQTACGEATNGETVRALAVTAPGNVTLFGKALTIKGGHADGYGTQNGYTTIQGVLTVGTGILSVERVVIR